MTNARAKNAVTKINQTTWFDTDDSAWSNVNVFVNKLTVIAPNAHAPTGSGFKTNPQIVAEKIANSCHASEVNTSGLGNP